MQVLAASIAALLASALLDTYETPVPRVFVSRGDRFYAKVVPYPNAVWPSAKGDLKVYAVESGVDTLLWQCADFAGSSVLLCEDGHHLVCSGTDGVSIYGDGKLMRSFTSAELGERPDGGWPPPSFGSAVEAELVRMTSADGTERIVDVRTGEIVATHEDAGVKPDPWRSLLRAPPRTPWKRVVDAWPLLLGAALVGLAIGLRVTYVRWRRQQPLRGA